MADVLDRPYGLDANAVTLAPWGRGILTGPEVGSESYVLKIEAKFANPAFEAGDAEGAETETRWITVTTNQRPYTTADLETQIMGYQPQESDLYVGAIVGYGRVQILQV